MLLALHANPPRAGHAHEQHVHLLVRVLPDTPFGAEAHQVGVEVAALFQRPDHPNPIRGRSDEVIEVRTSPGKHALSRITRVVGMRDLETAARALAAVAMLADRHLRKTGDQRLDHAAYLGMVRRYCSERATVTPDHDVPFPLLELGQPPQLVEYLDGPLEPGPRPVRRRGLPLRQATPHYPE